MIYLIKSAGYDENENLIHLLKIGYTEDNNRDRRFMSYKLHNPTCKILYEIPSLSEDIEKRIQYKFRDYKYKEYGNEWFYYNDDVINFFRDIDKVDLESLPKSPMSEKRDYKRFRKMVKEFVPWIIADIKDRNEYVKKIIDELGSNLNSIQDILDYVIKDYGEDSISKYLEVTKKKEMKVYSEDSKINSEIIKFINTYETLTTIYDKLKMLCEYPVSKEVIQIVLDQIGEHDNIKSYYISLGSQKLRALGYDKYKIEKELGIVTFSYELLESSIYSEFKVGDKLTLSSIKDRLDYLYKSISYTATPKATDLEKFFEIKNSSIYEDGKKIKCYTLLSRKEAC